MHVLIRREFLRLLMAVAVSLLASVSWAQADYRPPLWEVRSGDTTVYLFGTIHVGKPDFYPLPAAVESAFRQADVLALEVDPTEAQEAMNAMIASMYTPPDSIERHVAPTLLAQVRKVAAAYGVQFEQIRQMKPYLLMFTLTSLEYARLGYDASSGMENHLSQRARSSGKKIVSLESMGQQMQMLDGLSNQLQAAMLQVTVEEILNDSVTGLVTDMISAWRSGNTARLGEVLTVEERRLPPPLAREFHSRFLTERNINMANMVARMLEGEQKVFVAVGALHMVGDDGIPALLAAKGYKVKPL